MTRTTPPRAVNVAEVLPDLAPLARQATRLHPRPGSPTIRDSSVGGPLLWPADEPWPHCDGPHIEPDRTGRRPRPPVAPKDVLVQRRVQAAEARRPRSDPRVPEYTEEERDVLKRAGAGVP